MNALSVLDNPVLWEMSRLGLDWTFGLYRKRIRTMRSWAVLDGAPALLDIGCGIGQYSRLTRGEYLGIDLNARYISYARRRNGGRTFEARDVSELCLEGRRFDLVLMVDFLHHLPDPACVALLESANTLARKYVVSFEPVISQSNPLGRWIIAHDRGHYMRSLEDLHGLFDAAGLKRTESRALRLGPINTRAVLCRPSGAFGAENPHA